MSVIQFDVNDSFNLRLIRTVEDRKWYVNNFNASIHAWDIDDMIEENSKYINEVLYGNVPFIPGSEYKLFTIASFNGEDIAMQGWTFEYIYDGNYKQLACDSSDVGTFLSSHNFLDAIPGYHGIKLQRILGITTGQVIAKQMGFYAPLNVSKKRYGELPDTAEYATYRARKSQVFTTRGLSGYVNHINNGRSSRQNQGAENPNNRFKNFSILYDPLSGQRPGWFRNDNETKLFHGKINAVFNTEETILTYPIPVGGDHWPLRGVGSDYYVVPDLTTIKRDPSDNKFYVTGNKEDWMTYVRDYDYTGNASWVNDNYKNV